MHIFINRNTYPINKNTHIYIKKNKYTHTHTHTYIQNNSPSPLQSIYLFTVHMYSLSFPHPFFCIYFISFVFINSF